MKIEIKEGKIIQVSKMSGYTAKELNHICKGCGKRFGDHYCWVAIPGTDTEDFYECPTSVECIN